MAEHRVPKGNIIYIIPTDELFIKYKNNEAFIDEYGRLMNRKPHRVLKELKHYVADSEMQESYASSIKDLVRDKMVEYSKYAIDRVGDVFFYEVIPNVWHKHIVPLWNGAKDVLFSKELKIDQIKCETEYKVVENQSIFSETMTKEEVENTIQELNGKMRRKIVGNGLVDHTAVEETLQYLELPEESLTCIEYVFHKPVTIIYKNNKVFGIYIHFQTLSES